MAIITSSIGTASRTYSTIALWEAALPASAVTAGNSYVGELYNDSEFDLGSTKVSLAGTTTDATHTIKLTAAAGQGFKDNGSAATNALRYNAANGAAVKIALAYDHIISVSDNYVTISNLQFLNTNGVAHGAIFVNGTNFVIDNCILQSGQRANGASQILSLQSANATVRNCLIISDSANGVCYALFAANAATFINNTVVRPSNNAASTSTGIGNQYQAITVQNCVVAGFNSAITQNGANVISGSGNAIDKTTYPGSATGQTSLTIATEFVQPSNASSAMDWRLNSTAIKCKDNGTNSGAPATDIIGQAISNTTRDVGCWELQQGGAAKSVVAGVGSYALAGTIAGLRSGRNLVAAVGAYALTGAATTVVRRELNVGALPGSYSLTGTAAILRHSSSIAAVAGSYSLVGTAANLTKPTTKSIVASAGAYSLVGATAGLQHGYRVAASVSSYLLTGNSVAFQHAYKLVAGVSSYALAGAPVTMTINLPALPGSYSLTGATATLRHSLRVAAGAGSYALVGTDANLTKLTTKTILASAGAYSLTGANVVLRRTHLPLVAGVGSYSLVGATATLRHGWRVAAGVGSYALVGTAANLTKPTTKSIVASAGSYLLTGTDVALRKGRLPLAASPASYSLSGTAANLARSHKPLVMGAGAYALTGVPASFKTTRKLAALAGSYTLIGSDAALIRTAGLSVTFNITEAPDTASFDVVLPIPVVGSFDITEPLDVASFQLKVKWDGVPPDLWNPIPGTGDPWNPITPPTGIWTPVEEPQEIWEPA